MHKVIWAALLLVAGGCSGNYILTVPDQLAPAGGEATAVIRVQRNEFAGYPKAVKDSAIRFQVDGNELRAAYTDKKGYAGAAVPVGNKLGKFYLHVQHLDRTGVDAEAWAPCYVWDPQEYLVAVDLDGLPTGASAKDAAAAVSRVAKSAHVVYFTHEDVDEHGELRRRLEQSGYPDGPVLKWQQEGWHVARTKLNVPYLVIEPRLVSTLSPLRKQFPNFTAGICTRPLAAKAFAQAGLKVTVVGNAKADPSAAHLNNWSRVEFKP